MRCFQSIEVIERLILVKLNQQFSASLAQHRKKTGRDLALLQEMMLQMMHTFYMYNSPLAELI